MIKYGYTILYIENVEKTVEFYTNAFGLKQKFITPEKDHAELETGGTTLAFAAYSVTEYNGIDITKSNVSDPSPAFEVAFVTDDIDDAYQKAIAAGAVGIKEPTKKPWGQTVAYVRNFNGFLVELCTAM
jgi:uncharacterized glyoxalase superfamily protein PhnB